MLIIGSFCPKTVLKSNRKVIKNDVFIFIAVRYLIWHTTAGGVASVGVRGTLSSQDDSDRAGENAPNPCVNPH
jgi:hypothetical protein